MVYFLGIYYRNYLVRRGFSEECVLRVMRRRAACATFGVPTAVSLFFDAMKKKDQLSYVQRVAAAAAKEVGCQVVDVAFEKEPTGVYLRVYIDTDQGVSLDACERFHRLIQPKVENVPFDFWRSLAGVTGIRISRMRSGQGRRWRLS